MVIGKTANDENDCLTAGGCAEAWDIMLSK